MDFRRVPGHVLLDFIGQRVQLLNRQDLSDLFYPNLHQLKLQYSRPIWVIWRIRPEKLNPLVTRKLEFTTRGRNDSVVQRPNYKHDLSVSLKSF